MTPVRYMKDLNPNGARGAVRMDGLGNEEGEKKIRHSYLCAISQV